jgi:hypothetical protein
VIEIGGSDQPISNDVISDYKIVDNDYVDDICCF